MALGDIQPRRAMVLDCRAVSLQWVGAEDRVSKSCFLLLKMLGNQRKKCEAEVGP